MASAWGFSWGSAWGDSWGSIEVVVVVGSRTPAYIGYAESRKPPKTVKVDSSHLRKVQYDAGDLNIEFKNGSVYTYSGVPEKRFNGLVRANSAGKYLHNNIVGSFYTTRRK